jgi:hypothetical protein
MKEGKREPKGSALVDTIHARDVDSKSTVSLAGSFPPVPQD